MHGRSITMHTKSFLYCTLSCLRLALCMPNSAWKTAVHFSVWSTRNQVKSFLNHIRKFAVFRWEIYPSIVHLANFPIWVFNVWILSWNGMVWCLSSDWGKSLQDFNPARISHRSSPSYWANLCASSYCHTFFAFVVLPEFRTVHQIHWTGASVVNALFKVL